MDVPRTGLVLRIDAKICHVEVDGQVVPMPLRGRLFEQGGGSARPVAVGDRVRVVLDDDGGAIEEVLPRTNKLSRLRAGDDHREQVLAANLSMVLVVAAVVEPFFQADLVDRILAGSEHEKIEAVLVITKVDRDRKGRLAEWRALYEGLGYRVVLTSIAAGKRTDAALVELADLLHHNVTLLSGASGVGKSSLINTLCPGLSLRIGSITRIRQGRHTTAHTQLIALPGGGHVLDTPGIRSFGLANVDPQAVQFLFREIRPLIGRCDYRNCQHVGEPGCAVLAACESGAIAPTRYLSYLAVLEDVRRTDQAT